MWYIFHCRAGDEDKFLHSFRRHMTEQTLRDVFTFSYDRMKRYGGQWHTETRQMFPGYIFLESNDRERLVRELFPYRNIAAAMEDQDEDVLRQVLPEDERLLRRLCGQGHHLIISRGVIREGVACVTEGPLKGMEPQIRRIDRHKRLAIVRTPARNGMKELVAGLEIVAKNEQLRSYGFL